MTSGDYDYRDIVDDTMGFNVLGFPSGSKFGYVKSDVFILPVEKEVASILPVKKPVVSILPFPNIKLPKASREITEVILEKTTDDLLQKGGEIGLSLVGGMLASGAVPYTKQPPQVISEAMVKTGIPAKAVPVNKPVQLKKAIDYTHPILKYMKG